MSHSPGPWRWDAAPNRLRDVDGVPIFEPAAMTGRPWLAFDRESSEADRAIIAAAPRMLELLREVVWHGDSGPQTTCVCCDMCKPTHAADCDLGALLDELKKAGA